MELKEDYWRTFEKVLASLQTERDCNTRTEIAKAVAGEYWAEISKALKTDNVVSFASGRIWNVREEPLERCLLNVRMELDMFKQGRKTKRNERIWQVGLLFFSALISFWVGWFLRGIFE